ncbi:hypothetical protein BLX87_02665 [Bacillus sp. VT-16-64]|nr:hypothetical protein BLX87_02665 [Bacillus sp. VT-16-64]
MQEKPPKNAKGKGKKGKGGGGGRGENLGGAATIKKKKKKDKQGERIEGTLNLDRGKNTCGHRPPIIGTVGSKRH